MPLTQVLERKGLSLASFENEPVRCPAGVKCHVESGPPVVIDGARLLVLDNPAVRCNIEQSVITAAENPSSLAMYCMGGYTRCPSWRAENANRYANLPERDKDYARRPGETLVDQAMRGEVEPTIRVEPRT